MEKITNKKLWIGAVIIVLGWFALSMFNKPSTDDFVAPMAQQVATSSIPVVNESVLVKKAPTSFGNQPVSMSYQNALELYKDNKRIQISGSDTFCQASPNNVMYKNGTSIMIDNRSPQARTIKVGSTYTIPGYGFKVVKLSSASLPVTFLMDCDKQQNVAKILLQ